MFVGAANALMNASSLLIAGKVGPLAEPKTNNNMYMFVREESPIARLRARFSSTKKYEGRSGNGYT